MGSIDDIKSTLTQSALDALCEKFNLIDTIHPELPDRNNRIRNSPIGKIGVYTIFFDFANYRIPLSQFLVDVLEYFQINLSQLSVIATAKNDNFFWVDSSAFPLSIPWHNNKILKKVPHPTPTEFNAEVCDFLATHPAPFQKFSLSFLCLVGISRYYELDDNVYPVFLADDDEEMDLFAFISHADPTKVRISEKRIEEGQVPLLESTMGRVVPLADVNEQGNPDDNVQDVGHDAVVEEGAADGQDNPVDADIVRIEDDVPATVADKPKGTRKKRKTASGASGSNLPHKRLREDHGTSGDAGASTAGKSLVVLQDLLESSTLAAEVGVTAAATVPFITSSVTHTPKRESGGRNDSISKPNLRTQHPAERFVISSDSSHHSSANVVDDEVTFIVRSSVLPPPVLTVAVTTTAIAGATSAPVHESGIGPVQHNIFRDSASPSTAGADIAGPSQPAGVEVSTDTFYISQEMDSETLQQTYVPKWNVINDSTLDDPEVCRSMADQLAPPGRALAQLSLKEAEAAEAIRLRSQVVSIEGTKAAWVNELNSLKGWNAALEGQVTALEFAAAIKDTELASHRLSLSKAMIPLIEPLSAESLVGEASTFGVPTTAITTALSTTFTQTSSVPSMPVSAHDAEPHVEVPSSTAIVFEKEELETMPERLETS
ncbi:hypothetical protein Tco_0770761 [Tanacetum coccineum]|uniref:Transposase (Putative), gypsy type n=1 Tax=Tanacetum coccineum TaxID=301880 RepID=A0ABQ4ZDD8_9ASTR